ncbi:MAG: methyltransferase domain-containing protein [Luteitalea sp.]|nr:methyltransferase domain-containing protein [Luteitalea sp.]
MAESESRIDDLMARLERERLDADRRYNEALTAVDHAIQSPQALPPAPDYDPSRIAGLNADWDPLPADTPGREGAGSWLTARLRAFIWRLVGPPLEAQKRFNQALVDHLNRNARAHQQRAQALQALIESTSRELGRAIRFQSLLVQYLQTITAFVDSRDRAVGGVEIRDRLALTEQRLLALKRVVEQPAREARTSSGEASSGEALSGSAPAPFTGAVDSLTYVAFEDRFRGAETDIARRVSDYLPLLAAASDVVDIGCGRGELLAALGARGVAARGIDLSPAMVELSRSKGFDVEQGDALAYLERQPAASIGGLVAIQVVEHFTADYLTRFLDAAFHTMRPEAPLVLETINPACWMAFFDTYLRDVTHRQPLHADTLELLVRAAGFRQVDVRFRQPVSESDRLERVVAGGSVGPELAQVAAVLNDHAEKLNARIFSFMDYVVIARR